MTGWHVLEWPAGSGSGRVGQQGRQGAREGGHTAVNLIKQLVPAPRSFTTALKNE